MIPVFWCEPTGEGLVTLRRFTFSSDDRDISRCSDEWGHNASSAPVDRIPYVLEEREGHEAWGKVWQSGPEPAVYRGWEAWPSVCSKCGYVFSDEMPEDAKVCGQGRDNWQVHVDPLYRPLHVALEPFGWNAAPPGAMREAWGRPGPDGVALQVRCPRADGTPPTIADDWLVDSRASNCTLPDDREHYCWVRKGDPRAVPPTVTVSKDGPTCAAGAGSIQTHRWHGYLRDGALVE